MTENLPDRVVVPDDTILVITEDAAFDHLSNLLIEPLRGKTQRDWLNKHAYRCLPLLIGSQMGFIVKALYDFSVEWDGSESPDGTVVRLGASGKSLLHQQMVSSRFGMGTVTIQNRWTLRTPPGISLLTVAPPNYWIDGVTHAVAAIETDNLRRDFTFNLKVTRPHLEIFIRKGQPIGCLLPYPRGFIDRFQLVNGAEMLPADVIAAEREAARRFGIEREQHDVHNPGGIGGRYWRGEDVYGNKFANHQLKLGRDEDNP